MYKTGNIVNGVRVLTREYNMWKNMRYRCTPGSKEQVKYPRYVGCTMSPLFSDYQQFAGWANAQTGFHNMDDRGYYWALDKDIVVKGNKVYSEDVCVFVPSSLNNFLCKGDAIRGEYPLGVSKHRGMYKVSCRDGSPAKSPIHLGSYPSVEEAFGVYKAYKEALAERLAVKWGGQVDQRVVLALQDYSVEITD